MKNQTLLHFDAHHDCEIDYLSINNDGENLQIGNYISHALVHNIVKTFYWIVPGFKKDFYKNYYKLIRLLYQLKQKDYTNHHKITFGKGYLKTRILGKLFIVITIDQLPKFNENILLDIDLDYFFIKSLYKDRATDEIGLRKQWLSLSSFIKNLYRIITQSDCISISYSVNGGWTPAKYKHFGNLLAKKMRINNSNNENLIVAGEFFSKFRENLEKNNIPKARKYYKAALSLNPSYFTFDNNYGILYLMKGKLSDAEREFNQMLKVDKKYYYSYIGLGITNLIKGKYRDALTQIDNGLKIMKDNRMLLFLKALAYKYLKNYQQSKDIIHLISSLDKKNKNKEHLDRIIHNIFGLHYNKEDNKIIDISKLMNNFKEFSLLELIMTYEVRPQ